MYSPWLHVVSHRGPADEAVALSRGTDDHQQSTVRRSRLGAVIDWRALSAKVGSIAFADDRGRSQTLTTNNRKQKVSLEDRTIEVRTRWYDGRLFKETSLGDGLKLVEVYSLGSAGRQLHVTMKLEGSHQSQPVSVRRVYDPAP